MASANRHSAHGNLRGDTGPRTGAAEDTLKTETLQIERKTFIFVLKENPRGRFVRITEDVGGRRDSIIIPATGLEEFKRVLDGMLKAGGAAQEKAQQP